MLSKNQKNAINHFTGPALVLAVPGAGKTTVLINRAANLILNHKVNPKKILSITFSKASANDMKSRFNELFSDLAGSVSFSTIHSFCFSLVRDYSYMARIKYTLIEDPSNNINKYNLLRQLHFNVNGSNINEDKLEILINLIGYMKNMMIPPESYSKLNRIDIKNFPEIFHEYENFKKKNNLIDFDDMLTLTYEILLDNHYLRNKYQNMYSFIQLDEGQDTSKIQLEIIKLIAKPENNLFIVADDDQSIYGFRGAYPQGLFEFSKEYKDSKLFFMEENYRSSKNIVSASNNLIRKNSIRFNKNVFTNNAYLEPVSIIRLDSLENQYGFILDDLKTKSYSNSSILYRNNISSIGIVDFLDKNNIPFIIKDRNLKFFNHWILKDIINFIKFSNDTSNMSIYEKIFYKKKGYISRKQVNYAKKLGRDVCVFKRIEDFPNLPRYYKSNLKKLKKDFKKLSKLKPSNAIKYIETKLEYKNYLKEFSKKFGHNYNSLLQILNYLSLIAESTNNLDELIARLSYLSNLIKTSSNNKDGITLSTMHSAKGLEFDNVYIIDLIDGDFPNVNSIEDYNNGFIEDFEEERRLFYVAITRAKYSLSLIVIDWIDDLQVNPTRFINDLS